MKSKAVFLDRDGTINTEKNYLYKIEEFQLIPGVMDALRLLSQNKILIYIITNQSGIGRGFYKEKDFHQLTSHMIELFLKEDIVIQDVLFCPHHPDAAIEAYKQNCDCRKPANGLMKKVMRENELEPADVALVGDKNSDIEAGRSLGIKTYLVETGFGTTEKIATKADFIVPSLREAVHHLLHSWNYNILSSSTGACQ